MVPSWYQVEFWAVGYDKTTSGSLKQCLKALSGQKLSWFLVAMDISKLTYYAKKLALKPFKKVRVEKPMSQIPYVLAAIDEYSVAC